MAASFAANLGRRENMPGPTGIVRERGSRTQANPPTVEMTVTRLLSAIKLLLESLTQWSNGQATDSDVSDVYVRLGNDFNATVSAFSECNISMRELLGVPDDLRGVLEQCLSEDPTPANLEVYLPDVRRIITNLLQGLRDKQSQYRRIMDRQAPSSGRHRTTSVQVQEGIGQGHERTDSRSSRSDRPSRSDSAVAGPARPQVPPIAEGRTSYGDRKEASSPHDSIPTQSRRKPSSSSGQIAAQSAKTESDEFISAVFRPPTLDGTTPSPPPPPASQQTDARVSPKPLQEDIRESSTSTTRSTPIPTGPPQAVGIPNENAPIPAPPQSPAIINLPRFSLSDPPVPPPPPSLLVDGASPPPEKTMHQLDDRDQSATPPPNPTVDALQAPAMESSLAALKKSDALERRASRRFSMYHITKMTGGRSGASRERTIVADSSNLSTGDLQTLSSSDERATSRDRSKSNERGMLRRPPAPAIPSVVEEQEPPPTPPPVFQPPSSEMVPPPPPPTLSIETTQQQTADPGPIPKPPATASGNQSLPSPPPSTNLITVFLQIGRVVKKVAIIPAELSLSSLRVLFVDKFSYSPGQDNFPAIYIRDASSGVMYELEDVEEVKDRCLLSLNIEPLDQIKQHIDTQMATLSQELKELKTAVSVSNSMKVTRTPTLVAQPFPDPSPSLERPTERQFQHIARRISRMVGSVPPSPVAQIAPQSTGSTLQPQMTGASVASEFSGRIVTDLKTQFDEIQNLRRDLGVMRQIHSQFTSSTKESLSTLRAQAQTVRQLANNKVGGARAYIDSGKAKLDNRSQSVLTLVEELQDTVENVKDDVLKRSISPRTGVVKGVEARITEVKTELESLKEYVNTVRPMWKKTWEEELQNIVEEQQFLTHQEEFLEDLQEDYKALSEVFKHVQKVISIRGTAPGTGKLRSYKPPMPDEGASINSVMMEIRGASVDPERRLKAIAQSQKIRESERQGKTDEFENELVGFVSGKKLKMTGGAEEVERLRQRRAEQALKAMFNGQVGGSSGSPTITDDNSMDELPGETNLAM